MSYYRDLTERAPAHPADDTGHRLAVSAVTTTSPLTPDFDTWYAHRLRASGFRLDPVPLTALDGWHFAPDGELAHASGRFFRVAGLRVTDPGGRTWSQPVLEQPDIAILGILAREFDGVLHFLLQAKAEPGNVNELQLSPTVQATSSNYSRVHGGRPTPYAEYFTEPGRGRVLVDLLQSEQGSWFHHKRNRNVVIEVEEDVPEGEHHRWLTLGQIHALLHRPDLVNMDTRTVLACLPITPSEQAPRPARTPDPGFRAALRGALGRHPRAADTTSITRTLAWLARARDHLRPRVDRVPLDGLADWERTPMKIRHVQNRHFDIVGVRLGAVGREVANWTQPLLAPREHGVAALLVRRDRDGLQALVRADARPGYRDGAEIGPTVQCAPGNLPGRATDGRALLLDLVLGAAVRTRAGRRNTLRAHYDTVLSEEGGRFLAARNRYLVVEADADLSAPDTDRFRWVPVGELLPLMHHGHTVNVELRTLVTCLHTLW
jgi:dTDP-4-dehydro-6-deoxy-alpha-D-glucopyranose 2,3-dehydratase